MVRMKTLTGPNGKDEYGCQLYLGMFILNSAIQQAHEERVGATSAAGLMGTVITDAECTTFVYDGIAIGWVRKGERVKIMQTARDATGDVSHVKLASERFKRPCWIAVGDIDQDNIPLAVAPVD